MKKINIPILMYHDVLKDTANNELSHKMASLYFSSLDNFKTQIKIMVQKGYTGICFDDIPYLDLRKKYIILTFDDGWHGNYEHVLPLLKEYGFKGIVFVSVASIGSSGYMNWAELNELVQYGISVQSHTMTHRPLQTLSDEEIYKELYESKYYIEDRTQREVNALSFPHGSYNKNIVNIAEEVGYKIMCTSDIKCTFNTSFNNNNPLVLGRINIPQNIHADKFIKFIEYNKHIIFKEKMIKKIKNGIKRIIGIENYRRLYRKYFNIVESE